MAKSAAEQARVLWGMDQHAVVCIAGGGDGHAFNDALSIARGMMPQLVGYDGLVRKTTLAELNALFTCFGLSLLSKETKDYNLPGQMLFYQRGRLLVRIKTKGNPAGDKYRVDQPHLSVGLMKDDQDLSFAAEMVKFSPTGRALPKSTDAQPKNRILIPIKGTVKKPKYDGDSNQWAQLTHFNFPQQITLVS